MDAERMNDEAANAFLKTLEEPPSQCLLILATSQPDQLLQTIISRCVRVNLLQSAEFRLTPSRRPCCPTGWRPAAIWTMTWPRWPSAASSWTS